MSKNVSNAVKRRHQRARESRQLYKQSTGENLPYSEFMKGNANPSNNIVKTYEVTFSLNTSGKNYDFSIGQQTFNVSIVDGVHQNIDYIEENLKQSIANKFKGKGDAFIYNNTKVELREIRGVEEVKREKNLDFKKLQTEPQSTSIDKIEVIKTKGNKRDKYSYSINNWF